MCPQLLCLHTTSPFCCQVLTVFKTTAQSEHLFQPLKHWHYLKKIPWVTLATEYASRPMSVPMLLLQKLQNHHRRQYIISKTWSYHTVHAQKQIQPQPFPKTTPLLLCKSKFNPNLSPRQPHCYCAKASSTPTFPQDNPTVIVQKQIQPQPFPKTTPLLLCKSKFNPNLSPRQPHCYCAKASSTPTFHETKLADKQNQNS